MKKIITNAPLQCFTLHSHSIQRADQHYIIANSRNSCLLTRIHSVQLQESQKTFYIILNRKRCNNWHMISFIHCGSEKKQRGCMKTQKFVQATQFTNVVYFQTARRFLSRLLSRWLYSKLISTLKFLSKLKSHVLSYLTGATQHKDTGVY